MRQELRCFLMKKYGKIQEDRLKSKLNKLKKDLEEDLEILLNLQSLRQRRILPGFLTYSPLIQPFTFQPRNIFEKKIRATFLAFGLYPTASPVAKSVPRWMLNKFWKRESSLANLSCSIADYQNESRSRSGVSLKSSNGLLAIYKYI